MRTFLALEVPEKIKDEIDDFVGDYQYLAHKKIKWIRFENLHITLQFIGKTKKHDLHEIKHFFAEQFSKISAIHFKTHKVEIIPFRNPRIIWLKLSTENRKIYKISQRIKKKLKKLDYQIDNRSLKFHITIGRIKQILTEREVEYFLKKQYDFSNFTVNWATFYKSKLDAVGPTYYPLDQYQLQE